MFWIAASLILLAALAALLGWRFYLDREWQRELRYYNRHEGERPSENGSGGRAAKALYGAAPNLNNSRSRSRAADESRAVYERTVEKLREVSPKRYRRLNAAAQAEEEGGGHRFDDLPIFSAAREEADDTVFQTASAPEEQSPPQSEPAGETAAQRPSENPVAPSDTDAAEQTEQAGADAQAEPAAPDTADTERLISPPEDEDPPPPAPAPDAEVITEAEIGRFKRKTVQEIIDETFAHTHSGSLPEDEDGAAADGLIAPPEDEDPPPHAPAPDAPVITEAEVERFKREPAEAIIEKISPEPENEAVRRPPPDAEVITLDDIRRIQSAAQNRRRQAPQAAAVHPDETSLRGTQERALLRRIERDNQVFAQGIATPPVHRPSENTEYKTARRTGREVQTIGEGDIRSNLLRGQSARRRPTADMRQTMRPHTIADDEVLANLSRREGSPRRLRRVSTIENASILPVAARVSAYGGEVVKPQASRPKAGSALDNRFAPYPPRKRAEVPPPDATVVEPPAVPDTPPFGIDVPPPASVAFSAEMLPQREREEERPSENPYAAFADAFAEPQDAQEGAWANEVDWDEPQWDDAPQRPSENAQDAYGSRETHEQDAYAHEAAPHGDETPFFPDEGGAYPLPGLNLLHAPSYNPAAAQSEEALLENSITIEEKLAEFKVKVKVLDAFAGPVITRYEIEPDVGVRGNAVMNLEKDLARSLGVASIRVVETIPGKTCMGLELPNPKRQMIRLSEIFDSPAFADSPSKLTLALGQDITGQPVVTDLARAPHLLVAGTTGSGKSVGVNAMILSMLYKARPEDVRMIMIDPKMLELSIYEGIPHLLAPVVTDMRLAANALTWCVNEMEKRYRLMSHLGVRNLAGYNQKIREEAERGRKIGNPFSLTPDDPEPLEKLPFIVVVVDEFADLMMTAGKKIEELIARITQKARAAGIHLILATQRPSVDVITGLIKANIPTRIAFQVSSKIDSRTILDQMGAENLLGQGDMLFLPPGTGYPQRVHGAFASDEEVHGVVEYLKQFGDPAYVEDILTGGVGSDDMFSNANEGRSNEGGSDPLYDEAVACVIKTGKATISSVQRYLKIGYNRAANLIEQMEADGIISAADASGKRTVLARDSSHLDG